jgi:1-pyrroline-5-carboxylate dehydrogenase
MLTKINRLKFSLTNRIFGKEIMDFVHHNEPVKLRNYIGGKWIDPTSYERIINPMNGSTMFFSPLTSNDDDIRQIIECVGECPKSGLFNPLKHPHQYRNWGEILFKATDLMTNPEVEHVFFKLTQASMPKSHDEVMGGEVRAIKKFLENYTGDNPRFAAAGKILAGDSQGQQAISYRFPFGPVAIISPFNFPFKLPVINLVAAMITGNKPLLKPDNKGGIISEAFVRLLEYCGMPKDSMVLVHNDRDNTEKLMKAGKDVFRMVQFTGSSTVAHKLALLMKGKLKIEDSGYNWSILGPDVRNVHQVAHQVDQDAFAASGQKCSALRLLIMHKNWSQTHILKEIKQRAESRSLKNLTMCPILTWNNQKLTEHLNKIMSLPGASLITGGEPINESHSIPDVYGSFLPTLVYLPLSTLLSNEYSKIALQEVFAPFLIVTDYNDSEYSEVMGLLERIDLHLTAGVVSQDIDFINDVIRKTVNGVTYVAKGRTTGAPQNHFFGPGNDPRSSGVGTNEAIINTWTYPREVVYDFATFDYLAIKALKQS